MKTTRHSECCAKSRRQKSSPKPAGLRRLQPFACFLSILTGFLALVWFLIRVLPKPSRAAYPCQRVAMPVASSFVLWVCGMVTSIFALRKAYKSLARARYLIAVLCLAAGGAVAWWSIHIPDTSVDAWDPSDPPNTPMGVAKGIHPGRVVWVHEPDATRWDGSSNYWWNDVNTDRALVADMVSKSIRHLTGETDDAAAWDALFRHFNQVHGRGDLPYQAGERIAIKINMNVAGDYNLTNEPIASPQTVHALLSQLVHQAGVPGSAICIYDASRNINDAIYDPCHADFPEVSFIDKSGQGDRIIAARNTTVPVHYSDARVGDSGTSRFPECVVAATYLINCALLRGHSLAGVTLCAKNHFGSVWRPGGGFSPSNIHDSINRDNAMEAPNSLVDLMGHEHLDGKALLFIIDGLYGAVNQGSSTPSRWRSAPFDNDWTSSIFMSQDGVAIDSVALDFCRNEPVLGNTVRGSADNYLHEAALAHDPPSGTFYDPENDGTRLASLGVHEHWNNAMDKQYSRNLGTGDGIELFKVSNMGGFQRGDANADGARDLSDAVSVLLYLFSDGATLPCLSAADTNDSGNIDLADAIYLLSYLFANDIEPAAPFGLCGEDPTPDDLDCASYPPCGGSGGTTVTFVSETSTAHILVPPDGSLGLTWTGIDFNDSGWLEGAAAVGYDENQTYHDIFTTDIEAQMNGVRTSAYIRIPFTVDEALPLERLTLWIKYDDGFAAYLNGVQVATRNAPASPAWDSEATGSHSDSEAAIFEGVDLSGHADGIIAGDNVLAIHGLNDGLSSSDFLIAVELDGRTPLTNK